MHSGPLSYLRDRRIIKKVGLAKVSTKMDNFAIARQNMVDDQIRSNKVTDPAFTEAFLSLLRERW